MVNCGLSREPKEWIGGYNLLLKSVPDGRGVHRLTKIEPYEYR